jgi:hypothetical protein
VVGPIIIIAIYSPLPFLSKYRQKCRRRPNVITKLVLREKREPTLKTVAIFRFLRNIAVSFMKEANKLSFAKNCYESSARIFSFKKNQNNLPLSAALIALRIACSSP